MTPHLYAYAALIGLAGVLAWTGDRARADLRLCQQEHKTAVAEGRVAAFEDAAAKAKAIAEGARMDRAAILAELDTIARRAQQTRTVYRDRIREVPAATCAPGRERVDAWNEVLR